MTKGTIYLMNTAVTGLVKIGKTGTNNYQERMRFLESNGYYNIAGLKRYFAIELEDYDEKERMLHEIFSKHQVGTSELFALDQELVRQLLLSFEGKVIYPEIINKEKEFDELATNRQKSALFSFYLKGMKEGDKIIFKSDKNIVATVAGERDVEYGSQIWKLSPLTAKIYEDRGEVNSSRSYNGFKHWTYMGKKLVDLPDKYS